MEAFRINAFSKGRKHILIKVQVSGVTKCKRLKVGEKKEKHRKRMIHRKGGRV